VTRKTRTSVVLAVVATFACAVSFAQSSGEAVYTTKCQNCHGPSGLASSGIGQIMHVKPVTDPEVKKLSEEQMIAMTRNGSGKMQAWKGELTDAQIKSVVGYFRTFVK
jgi:mono/diheme cytochrome c family protein